MPAGKKIKDDRLLEAVNRAGRGRIEADLGGGLINSGWRGRVAGAPAVTGL